MPFESFGEGIFPLKKFFLSMRPQKDTSLSQTASFEYQASKSTGAFQRRVVTRSEKKLANRKPATSPYWADEPLKGECYESWFIA
jgi:hypothetical protein